MPAFVLVGKQRRRAISYDDGKTWEHDVSYENPDGSVVRCGDCDHDAFSPTGLAVSGPFVLHSMGHGAAGTVSRSLNGITWDETLHGPQTEALMVENGTVVLASRNSWWSKDDGLTWSGPVVLPFKAANGANVWNARGGGTGHGVFVVTAGDGADLLDVQRSTDGLVWSRPTMADGGRMDPCVTGSPIYANGRLAFVVGGIGGGKDVCSSTDDGLTWTLATITGTTNTAGGLIWNGNAFLAWSTGKVHRSPDAVTWTTEATVVHRADGGVGAAPALSVVARSHLGTFVSVVGRYETQVFLRSPDGVVWTELLPSAYQQGHPVTDIIEASVKH